MVNSMEMINDICAGIVNAIVKTATNESELSVSKSAAASTTESINAGSDKAAFFILSANVPLAASIFTNTANEKTAAPVDTSANNTITAATKTLTV